MKTTSENINFHQTNEYAFLAYNSLVCLGKEDVISYIKENPNFSSLQEQINYKFNNIELFARAMSHSSFSHEYKKSELKSYERLEFLGDSVVGSFISMKLFSMHQSFSEGKLSKIRSALVNEASLARLGKMLDLSRFVLLGKGELQIELSDSIYCDIFESLIGAICLDSSINESFRVLDHIIKVAESKYEEDFYSTKKLDLFDAKSRLQEYTMKKYKSLPLYKDFREGESFRVELWINGEKISETLNKSKKIAMKNLALNYVKEISNVT